MSSDGLSCADVRALSASVLTSLPALSLRPEQEMDMVCTSWRPHPDLARKSGPIGKFHLTCLRHQAHTLENLFCLELKKWTLTYMTTGFSNITTLNSVCPREGSFPSPDFIYPQFTSSSPFPAFLHTMNVATRRRERHHDTVYFQQAPGLHSLSWSCSE